MIVKKELVLYAENYCYGGVERFLFDLLNGIDRDKYSILFLHNESADFEARLTRFVECPTSRRSLRIYTIVPYLKWVDCRRFPQVVELILKVLLLGLQYVFLIGNIFLLRREFSKHRMDVLHIVNGGYPGGVSCQAAAIAARLNSRVLIIMSVLSYPGRYLFWPLERVVDSVVGRYVDVFITNSKASAYAMVKSRHFRARKVETVHTGVKKNSRDWTREAHAIRTQFAIPASAKIVGTVAAFQLYKGHRYLLDTIPAIRDRFPSVKYMLVGDGETKKELEEAVRSRELTATVVFTGYYPADVRGMIAAFDVFVLPSVYEGLPYVVLEAMSLAKPVIATDVAGIPEQVENGVSGILVPSRDSGLLADAIARLLGNEEEAQRMGIEARKRVERHFSVEDMLQKFDVLYGRVSL